ncbi:hypothetical protein ACRRS0_10585 [Agarivorans sp. QJM3NY_29]|uniref:hypothetical protein n=1 Tax=unclassified Agarivorans TaxID=2636026 RepID=UPI003D7CAA60
MRKQLKNFSPSEILITADDARLILKFIFKPSEHSIIDQLPMNHRELNLAQGLLVEAIDASYSIGYVEALFRSTANPSAKAFSIMRKFAKSSKKHWYKHATSTDLLSIKIYDFVVNELARRFKSLLAIYLVKKVDTNEKNLPLTAFLDYKIPANHLPKLWS